jgi:hypothetical protein
MTPSEDKAGIASADTSEKPRAPDEATAAEPSDAPEQASTDSSSTPDASKRAPPEEAEKEPAGPPSEEDPAALKEQLLRVLPNSRTSDAALSASGTRRHRCPASRRHSASA